MIVPPVDINQLIFTRDIHRESDNPEYILICNTHSGTWLLGKFNVLDCNYRHSQKTEDKRDIKKRPTEIRTEGKGHKNPQ